MDEWRLTASRPGSAGFLNVVTRTYDLPDGSTVDWDILDDGDTAAVLAITREGAVVLVRQFRPGPATVLDEMPGGFVDPGETPLAAAARELLEETGYRGTIELAGSCWLMASSTRRQWVAVATDCERVREPELGPDEFCETVLVSLAEFRAHLRTGRLTDVDLGYLALDHLGLLGDSALDGNVGVTDDRVSDDRASESVAARLTAQLAFVGEADRLKGVERRSLITDGSRRENSAEHSWHLALMAAVLAEHASDAVDPLRVVQMLLIHDLVEIDVGDTFVYDAAAREQQAGLEAVAAERIFGLLPGEQGEALLALWREFEAKETRDARFAAALDRLQPLMLNHASGGGPWQEHGISVAQVRAVNAHIAAGSTTLWEAAQALIDDAAARGYLAEER